MDTQKSLGGLFIGTLRSSCGHDRLQKVKVIVLGSLGKGKK